MAVIVLTMVTITAGMSLLMFALARAASMRTREEQLHEEVDAEFYRQAMLHRSGILEQDVHQGCAEQQNHEVASLG